MVWVCILVFNIRSTKHAKFYIYVLNGSQRVSKIGSMLEYISILILVENLIIASNQYNGMALNSPLSYLNIL